jgi:hypothetical protein
MLDDDRTVIVATALPPHETHETKLLPPRN